jgi:hypothetical protein
MDIQNVVRKATLRGFITSPAGPPSLSQMRISVLSHGRGHDVRKAGAALVRPTRLFRAYVRAKCKKLGATRPELNRAWTQRPAQTVPEGLKHNE